jgi:hypothetical protein
MTFGETNTARECSNHAAIGQDNEAGVGPGDDGRETETETGGRWRSGMFQVVESEAIDVRECAHPILPLGGASPQSSTSGH